MSITSLTQQLRMPALSPTGTAMSGGFSTGTAGATSQPGATTTNAAAGTLASGGLSSQLQTFLLQLQSGNSPTPESTAAAAGTSHAHHHHGIHQAQGTGGVVQSALQSATGDAS